MTGGTRHLDFGIELVKRGYKVYIISSDSMCTNYNI